MSRKSFIIWGLVIIQLYVACSAVLMYLSVSKIIDVKSEGSTLGDSAILAALIGFGIILYLRFKTVGRRKRTLVLCVLFFIIFGILGGCLALGYVMTDIVGAYDRYFGVIHRWAEMKDPKPALSWSVKQRLDFVLFHLPAFYLMSLGLFALLAFGSLDPRKPSKNRIVQFLKTGFQRKVAPNPTPSTARPQEIMA